MMMRMIALALAFSVTGIGIASTAESGAGLSITADVQGSIVVLDGVVAGKTPLHVDSLSAGVHHLRLLHPNIESWVSPVIIDSVRLAEGESRDLNYRFTRPLFVLTEPSGAEVVVGSRVVGTTPLLVDSDGDSLMEVRMRGYHTVGILPDATDDGVLRLRLGRSIDDPDELPHLVPEEGSRSSLPLILSGASSVLAGGFSVYFKVRADEVYGEYLRTGDPSKLAETRKLDNVAGIALGAAEIYFALFSYLLLTQ